MAELADGTVVARRTASGRDSLVVLGPRAGHRRCSGRTVEQPCVAVEALCAHGDGLAFIGSTPDSPPNVWVWPPAERPPAPPSVR